MANVGIDGARITSITTEPLTGRATIDATNLVVSPGFIDLLSYEPNDYGAWFKIGDGVTTNLGMHGLNNTAKGFFEMYGSKSMRPPVHYGGAFDDSYMRGLLKVKTQAATPAQIEKLVAAVEQSFADGYIGLSFEPEYTPYVTDDEINAMAAAAKKHDMPVTFHVRYSSPDEPGKDNATALAEVLQVARATGASVHVDHITSTGGTHTMPQSIATLEQARSDGIDVTACMYPYDFWATTAGSARFNDGWQERFRISYGDLAIPGKGERLTESTFNKARRDNTLVAAYAIPEEDVVTGLQTDWIMIGSDAILEPANNNHPRSTGCFTRVLGRYVRDQQVLDLPDGPGQDDDHAGQAVRHQGPRPAAQGPPADGRRRRHHHLRPGHGGRRLHRRRPGPDGQGRVVRAGQRPGGQGGRHAQQGPPAGRSHQGRGLTRADRDDPSRSTPGRRSSAPRSGSSVIARSDQLATAGAVPRRPGRRVADAWWSGE